MVQAMVKGAQMTVKGTSNRGTVTADVYSLNGFTAAYKAIGQACGGK
ncbi:MAG: invasion associated locus B family protein [Rhodospirillales bacterium]